MELYVLNRDFEIINYIDTFVSLEWVKRYFDTGDFVLNCVADQVITEKKLYCKRR